MKKNKVIQLRVTEKEYDRIAVAALRKHLTISAYILWLVQLHHEQTQTQD